MADQDTASAVEDGKGKGRYLAWGAAGAGLAVALVGAWFVYRETSIEKPHYALQETDGDFEVRDYPALVIAETHAGGPRERALDTGFTRLADYIFAKARDGQRLAMTAPVLSLQNGTGWLTRFVMPARFTAETLPEPQEGVSIDTVPARRVAAIRFSGEVNDALLAEKESQLRSWLGAKKLEASGPAEHAYYNSPMVPSGMRKSEVLIPIG